MKVARIFTFAGIVMGTVALGAGFAADGPSVWLAIVVGAGLVWLLAEWQQWGRVTTFAFVVYVGLAATGMARSRPAGWMVIAVMMALSAWSLGHFIRRIGPVVSPVNQTRMAQVLLLRLLALNGISLLLSVAALRADFSLTFWPVLLSGVLLVYGFSRLVAALRRANS